VCQSSIAGAESRLCSRLQTTTVRYKSRILALAPAAVNRGTTNGTRALLGASFAELVIEVAPSGSSAAFVFPVDESYNLTIKPGGPDPLVKLSAATQWGALRGLETVLQLCEGARIGGAAAGVPTPLELTDAPRFGWRGVMMDLARHFYSVGFIKKTMDAMEANKMNVRLTRVLIRACLSCACRAQSVVLCHRTHPCALLISSLTPLSGDYSSLW
jgi:hypothetical protein